MVSRVSPAQEKVSSVQERGGKKSPGPFRGSVLLSGPSHEFKPSYTVHHYKMNTFIIFGGCILLIKETLLPASRVAGLSHTGPLSHCMEPCYCVWRGGAEEDKRCWGQRGRWRWNTWEGDDFSSLGRSPLTPPGKHKVEERLRKDRHQPGCRPLNSTIDKLCRYIWFLWI